MLRKLFCIYTIICLLEILNLLLVFAVEAPGHECVQWKSLFSANKRHGFVRLGLMFMAKEFY